MDLVHTYAAGDQVASADLNNIQSQAASLYQVAWSWRGRRPTLEYDGTNLTVGAHNGCAMGTTQAGAVFVPDNTAATVSTPGLSTTTWYYVYAYNDAGSCNYEFSTTAPDAAAARAYKAGDQTRAYVGCFRTDSVSPDPLPFFMVDGQYTYRWSKMTLPASFLLLLNGTAVSPTYAAVDASLFVPPTARVLDLQFVMVGSAYGDTVALRTNGDTTGASLLLSGPNGLARVVLSTDQKFSYIKSAGPTNVSFFAAGFSE